MNMTRSRARSAVRSRVRPAGRAGVHGEAHVFHQYVVRARERDALRAHLAAAGVGTQVYYATPLHLQPALAHLGVTRGALPQAERAATEVLALPIYPALTPAQVDTVVEAITRFYRAGA